MYAHTMSERGEETKRLAEQDFVYPNVPRPDILFPDSMYPDLMRECNCHL
jgi:hypothetical protein